MKPFISAGFLITVLATACSPTPEMIQTAIAQTQAAYTPTPEPTATPKPTVTETPTPTLTVRPTEIELEPWRIPPMPEMIEIVKDTTKDTSITKWVEELTVYYGIKLPVHWELYRMPDGTSPDIVMAYYKEKINALGYGYFSRKGYDEINGNYVLEYNKEDKTIFMSFWKNTKGIYCRVLVIYKNVES